MRRDEEFFGECELALIYMARRLKRALAAQQIFDARGIDYLLETGPYLSGLLFRTSKVGVFFYTKAEDEEHARTLLREAGIK